MMLIPLNLSTIYDLRQFCQDPKSYISSSSNNADLLFMISSYVNIKHQFTAGKFDIDKKIYFIIVVILSLYRMFLYMRFFKPLSYLFTMFSYVLIDIRAFFLFYFILILMLSQVTAICEGMPKYERAGEYKYLTNFSAKFISTIRLSLGDFDFGGAATDGMSDSRAKLFFFVWCLMVVLTNLIFLNFIIAEVCNSYQKVLDTIDMQMEKERLSLVQES